MRHISSNEVNATYQKLLKRYKDEGYVNPKAVLDYNIRAMVKEGITEKEAIFHLYRFPEDGQIEKETKQQKTVSGVEEQEQKKRDAAKEKIAELKKKITQLTVLFSSGEISEESYKTAVRAVEKEMDSLNDQLPQIIDKTQFQKRQEDLRRSIYSGGEEPIYSSGSRPTVWWWLVPFLFGIIGGLVAYIGVKDEDSNMALNLLTFSIFWTIFLALILFLI